MSIVFAVPRQVVTQDNAAANLWPGMRMTWEAYDPDLDDVTVWDISHGREGVILLAGLRGLGSPEYEFYEDEYPGVPGSRHRKAVAVTREVFWPTRVRNVLGTHHGSTGFQELDVAWWRTLDPDRTGIWKVYHPTNGSYRSLRCRFVSDGPYVVDTDPLLTGREVYGITLRANQPLWEGQPVTESWEADPPKPAFIGPDDPEPGVVRLSSSFTLDDAVMTNPGQVDAFPTWYVKGPTTSVQLGVSGRTIQLPFPIPDAQHVAVVDTGEKTCFVYELTTAGMAKDPKDWEIGVDLINPVERTGDLGEASFAPIPAGKDRELSLAMEGSGLVLAKITPLYKRAR